MTRLSTVAFAVLGLVACGPAWSGKVSGYTLDTREALFTPLDDGQGHSVGALVVLSDQSGLCAALAATKAPPNATFAAFTMVRQADGKLLSPDVGDYIIGASSSAAASAAGLFIHTDANGTNAIPSANRFASSGKFQITEISVERGSFSGQFDGKFGAQNDTVNAAIHASLCSIDTATIRNGFLGAQFGGSSNGPPPATQSPECADYLACLEAFSSGSTNSLQASYGVGGTCWTTTTAAASSCTNACSEGLASLRQSTSAPSVCFR